ncbi:MAG: hypothetical protein NTV30_10670 [Chloroflexi bacterium]|nr:hypothetical protein [Chloroflexota bacterium]
MSIISIVSLAILIIGTVTMLLSSFGAVRSLSDSWKQMEQQSNEMRNTQINAGLPGEYSGGDINLVINNDGKCNLNKFESWDIIATYQDGSTQYIIYTENTSPGNNQWTMEGIYLPDGRGEVFDPGILNPGEDLHIKINTDPDINEKETCLFTISTSNGVTDSCMVSRE